MLQRILIAGVLGAALAGCAVEDTRPNLVVVTIDTLRADHCSAYGYARDTTPFLETLAAAG
jgi:glucan phosphoethanolaminetransferase (alkaline phosphatase superfamily)